MSPRTALESPVFAFYFAMAVGLLVVGGLVLALLHWGLRKNVGHAWSAYLGWLLMVPILLLCFFLGRAVGIVFLTLVAMLGFQEFARAVGLTQDWLVTGIVHLGIVALGVICWIPNSFELFLILPVFAVLVIVSIPVLRNRTQNQLRMMGMAVLGFIYFGWMFGHLALLTNSTHAYGYIGYLVVAVEINDVTAYVSGKLLGRHPFRSEISPKKTWEGAFGALVVSMALPWILRFTFPHFDVWDCLIVGLMVGIGGQMGDLVVSVIKRDVGIKDMGSKIPGHGGILDRIDSLIYVAPLFLHYVRVRHGLTISP